MEGLFWILPLTSLLIVAAIVITIVVIVHKVKKFTEDSFGAPLSEVAKELKKGYQEAATMPKAINSLTAVYKPKIERDFPEVGYANMEQTAQNALMSVFNAIEAQNASKLSDKCSPSLEAKVRNIINDTMARNEKETYDNIKIHRCGISAYKTNTAEYIAIFEMSVEYVYKRFSDGKLVFGSDNPVQTAYSVTMTYDQKEHEKTTSIVYSSTCPHCGAPLDAGAGNKKCPYCGGGFTEIASRLWRVSDFNLLK